MKGKRLVSVMMLEFAVCGMVYSIHRENTPFLNKTKLHSLRRYRDVVYLKMQCVRSALLSGL